MECNVYFKRKRSGFWAYAAKSGVGSYTLGPFETMPLAKNAWSELSKWCDDHHYTIHDLAVDNPPSPSQLSTQDKQTCGPIGRPPTYSWTSIDAEAAREGKAMHFLHALNNVLPDYRVPADTTITFPSKEQQKLLDMLHPLKGGMDVTEAAKKLHTSVPALYKQLQQIKETCPRAYAEYARWPTPALLEVFKMLHPESGGCTSCREVAERLGIDIGTVYARYRKLRSDYPDVIKHLKHVRHEDAVNRSHYDLVVRERGIEGR